MRVDNALRPSGGSRRVTHGGRVVLGAVCGLVSRRISACNQVFVVVRAVRVAAVSRHDDHAVDIDS